MNISQTIFEYFSGESKAGKKQVDIAKKHNVDQQIISRILSGKRRIGGLTLDTVEKMFPDATINFKGATIQNSGTAFVNGNVVNKTSDSGIPADVLKGIMSNKDSSPKEKAEIIAEIIRELSRKVN